ncbi:hypothetical protein ACFQZF_07960 [Flavobacterium myungsuense]|uniref:DUF304 domain-containing protein n=1 Tax=Flavobacterium myungsuense TaxID=651823 RepID=A0ABW3IZ31_9FLAO
MKIQYRKKRLNFSLIFGILWLSISLLGIFTKENSSWTDYGFLIISFLYLGTYLYEKKNQYMTIENGVISVNKPFEKKINLTEIKQIKKFAGDYTLKTDKAELTINTHIIEPNSLSELDAVLEKLNVESD